MRWLLIVAMGCSRAADEPPAPPPTTRVVPLAGEDTFDPGRTPACLVATVGELRKHPHWTIRVDDMRSPIPNIDTPAALDGAIEWDASGVAWHDGFLVAARTLLDATAVVAIDRALAKSCLEDSAWVRANTGERRAFEIGYGITGVASIQLPESAPVSVALAPIFDAGRAAHVAAQRAKARASVLALDGYEHVGKRWAKRHVVIDLGLPATTDADAVAVLDWATSQPEDLPAGPQRVAGTLTTAGTRRAIAISLDVMGDRARAFWALTPPLAPLWRLSTANAFQYDFQ